MDKKWNGIEVAMACYSILSSHKGIFARGEKKSETFLASTESAGRKSNFVQCTETLNILIIIFTRTNYVCVVQKDTRFNNPHP